MHQTHLPQQALRPRRLPRPLPRAAALQPLPLRRQELRRARRPRAAALRDLHHHRPPPRPARPQLMSKRPTDADRIAEIVATNGGGVTLSEMVYQTGWPTARTLEAIADAEAEGSTLPWAWCSSETFTNLVSNADRQRRGRLAASRGRGRISVDTDPPERPCKPTRRRPR